MKIVVFLFLVLSCSLYAYEHSFLPDNDLWKDDSLYKGSLTEATFNNIIDAGVALYAPIAQSNNEKLTIKKLWSDSTVNASTSRFLGTVTIKMYGGLARRPEINTEGFAMVMCHELGHAYGGKPYIAAAQGLSAEGQSDYYSARECTKMVIQKIIVEDEGNLLTSYAVAACNQVFRSAFENKLCLQVLNGSQALGNLLAVIKKENKPEFNTPDPYKTDKTLLSYPKTVQCRLDTMFNGALNFARPACWFKD